MTKLGSIQNPDLAALLDAWRADVFFALNCHQLGTIVSFDKDAQTAQVTLNVLRVVGDRTQAYPILVDVPVFVPAGGDACLTMPVAPGDTCLVLFNDRDIDNWFDAGAVAVPNSQRAHSLADGLALVGFRSRANPVADYADDSAELRKGSSLVSVGAKIGIANDSGSLLTSLDALMAALLGWVNTGGSTPNPATVTALTAVKTQIDALLK